MSSVHVTSFLACDLKRSGQGQALLSAVEQVMVTSAKQWHEHSETCAVLPFKVHTDQQEKGEDWEHEEARDDDDLEQGDDEASDQDVAAQAKK